MVMTLNIERASGIGFCFGVKRAVDMLEKAAAEYGTVETLGAAVHNQPVMQRLAGLGVTVAPSIDDIKGKRVAIGAHGVSPEVEQELRRRGMEIIDTTCPFVHRAQVAAKNLSEAGFFTVIYGDANHSEIKSVLGWAGGNGIATLDEKQVAEIRNIPRWLGVLSQTTKIAANFNEFVKKLVDVALSKDSEIRIIDTICHDIRQRQQAALALANDVDLMLVIGGHSSANSGQLVKLCSSLAETYLVETADEIQPEWLCGHIRVGVTSGASTDDQTISEVIKKLKKIKCESIKK